MATNARSQPSQELTKFSLSSPVDYFCHAIFSRLIFIPQQMALLFGRLALAHAGDESPPPSGSPTPEPPLTTKPISKHLQLHQPVKPSLTPDGRRRIVLFYAWLTAKPRNIRKYTKLLTDLGIDVLIVRTYPLDLLMPTTGSKVIAEEVTEFLKVHTEYEQYMVFACSVGAYVFCETVFKMREVPVLVEEVLPKFVGQLYDSAVDIQRFSMGVAYSVTNNATLQGFVKAYIDLLLKVCHESNTKHYLRAAELMYECPVGCPASYTYSSNDPLSPPHITEGIGDMWRGKGIKINSRVFGAKSGHCLNLPTHPAEYRKFVYDFLETINMADRETINVATENIRPIDKETIQPIDKETINDFLETINMADRETMNVATENIRLSQLIRKQSPRITRKL